VKARPRNDTVRPGQYEAHVIIRKPLNIEGDDRQIRMFIINGDILLFLQFPNEERDLPMGFFRKGDYTPFFDESHSRFKGGKARVMVCPYLKPFRHPTRMEKREGIRPGPAKAQRCDGVMIPDVKPTRTGYPKQTFVPGKDKGINREVMKRYRNMTCSLGTIDNKIDSMVVQDIPNGLNVLHRAEHIAAVGHDHELSVRTDGCLDDFRSNKTPLERDDTQLDTVLLGILMEWPEHGVVIQCGGQDVTFFLYSCQKARYEDIKGIGCVKGENNVFRGICSQEGGESFPGPRDVILALRSGCSS
jgi:hypothetical protein